MDDGEKALFDKLDKRALAMESSDSDASLKKGFRRASKDSLLRRKKGAIRGNHGSILRQYCAWEQNCSESR